MDAMEALAVAVGCQQVGGHAALSMLPTPLVVQLLQMHEALSRSEVSMVEAQLPVVEAQLQYILHAQLQPPLRDALAAWRHALPASREAEERALVAALVLVLPYHEGIQVVARSMWCSSRPGGGTGFVTVSQTLKAYWMYRGSVLGLPGVSHAASKVGIL